MHPNIPDKMINNTGRTIKAGEPIAIRLDIPPVPGLEYEIVESWDGLEVRPIQNDQDTILENLTPDP